MIDDRNFPLHTRLASFVAQPKINIFKLCHFKECSALKIFDLFGCLFNDERTTNVKTSDYKLALTFGIAIRKIMSRLAGRAVSFSYCRKRALGTFTF
jgi:hypothetical protein